MLKLSNHMMYNSIFSDRLPKEQKLKANRLLMSASSSSKRACNLECMQYGCCFFLSILLER
jgi:hypothetical protein